MWEYKFVGIDDTTTSEYFNQLGADRWELVTVYQSGSVHQFEINGMILPTYVIDNQVAMFKRIKKN